MERLRAPYRIVHRSLRFKILASLIPILAILVGLLGSLEYLDCREHLMDGLNRSATHIAQVTQSGLRHAMLTQDSQMIRMMIDDIAASEEETVDLLLVNKEGQIKFSPQGKRAGERLGLEDARCQICHRLEPENRSQSTVLTTEAGEKVLRSVNPIPNETECHACHDPQDEMNGILVIDLSMARMDAELAADLRNHLFLLTGMLVALALIVNFMMKRMVVSKLEGFVRATRLFGKGDLAQRVTIESEDEIGELAHSFNEMAEKVQAQTETLSTLHSIASTLSQSLDLDTVLSAALDKVLESTGFEPRAGIFLLDSESQELHLKAHRGLSPEFVEREERIPMGECLCGLVAQSGEILYSPSSSQDTRHTRMREQKPHSHLIVPLKAKDKVMGVMFFYPEASYRPNPQDLQLLASIGNQIGVAIENARLYEETKCRMSELAALQEVSLQVTSSLDLAKVLESIAQSALKLVEATDAHIFLYDEEKGEFRFGTVVWDSGEKGRVAATPRENGLTATVARQGEPLVINDAESHPLFTSQEAREWKVKAITGFPLKRASKVLGVLNVAFLEPHTFDEGELRILALLADQAAIAIENARLFEVTKSQLTQLTALQETTRAVASTLELDKLLHLITQQATTLLQSDGGIINLVDWEKNEDEVVAATGSAAATLGYRSPLEGSLSGWVTLHNQPVISNQLQSDSRAASRWRSGEEQNQSAAIAPLTIKDQVIGTLVVMDKQGGQGEFDQTDLDLLVAFANQAATAIENARLYEATQRELAERKRAEEALRKSEESFNRMVTSVEDVLYSVDGKTREFSYLSPAFERLLGYTLEDVRQMGGRQAFLSQVIEGGKFAEQEDTFEQLLSREVEQVPSWERWWRCKDGSLICLEDRWLPIYDGERLISTDGVLRDITARKRAEEQAQKRLREVTALHKVAEIINASLDLKEVFQRVVEELSNAFGYRLVDIYLLEKEGLRLQAQMGYDVETTIDFIPLKRGVVGRVARTGQPAFIRDVSQDPDYIPSYPDITSEICVPIKSGENLLGVLNVECDECRLLAEDDLLLLHTLSSHIGVAIENACLYEEEQRRSAQRRTIAEVGRRTAAILKMDALLAQVVDLIAQNFGYYLVHIFQIDPGSEYAVYKAGTGEAALVIAEEGVRLKVGEEGIIGWVALHGQPLLVNDVSHDPRYYPHPALPDTRSELSVPIRVGERIIGVLDVQSTELNAFDESDLDALQTLADQLAVAMENARLYQETEQLAITDGLTGLYNLRYFYETLEKEIQRSERYHRSVSLIILDIDDFKAYNDTYGHLAGDDLLVELTQLMSKVTRRTDTLARYGGEEFAIILPETETGGAEFLAERLLEEVREHRFSIQDDQTIGRITISLGVATHPHHADSTKALVDAADKALLSAKRAGKHRLSVYGGN